MAPIKKQPMPKKPKPVIPKSQRPGWVPTPQTSFPRKPGKKK